MLIVKVNVCRCATCATWFGGIRVFDGKGNVRYDTANNRGICKHPLSLKKGKESTPNFTCSRWSQGN